MSPPERVETFSIFGYELINRSRKNVALEIRKYMYRVREKKREGVNGAAM